jgi:antitoxin PrlF
VESSKERAASQSRVTSKGQVTIPSRVRTALNIEQGDDLVFEIGSDHSARLRVVKRQRLTDLYGTLAATRPFFGREAVRDEVGRALSVRHKGAIE